jgi:hypothetical protein
MNPTAQETAMEGIFRLSNIRTTLFAWAALACIITGWAIDAVTGPLWVRFGIHANALEYIGGGLAALGYWSLWLLLPVSAFRPETRFYRHGDCSLRVKRFILILSLLVAVHLWIILAIAFLWR